MTTPTLSSVANPGNFLRTTRSFPADMQELRVELNKMYTESSTQINNRISGIIGTNMTITGEAWYLDGENGRQQSLRQAYTFTSAGSILHGLNTATITGFTRIFGSFTDGTNFYPLPYVNATAATNQVQVDITPTNIVITAGGGAPAIVSGVIVLEWLS